jgi:hypothetical protein
MSKINDLISIKQINHSGLELSFREACAILEKNIAPLQLMRQNESGDLFTQVFDSQNGGLKAGIRYHLTSDGGDIHTDAPQYVEQPSKVALFLISRAESGGRSIFVSGKSLYDFLIQKAGFSREEVLSPIPFKQIPSGEIIWGQLFSFHGSHLTVRYLKSYVRAALREISIDSDKLGAIIKLIDSCDEFLENEENYTYIDLSPGDLIIFDNKQLLHGRTSFLNSPSNTRKLVRAWMR